MEFLILIALGFILIWMLIILPQRRRTAAHRRLVSDLNPGDEVMTAGGLLGRVTGVDEDEVRVEVARGVEVRVAKRAIATVFTPEGPRGFPAV